MVKIQLHVTWSWEKLKKICIADNSCKFCLLVGLFCYPSLWRIFHEYAEITIAGEGLGSHDTIL